MFLINSALFAQEDALDKYEDALIWAATEKTAQIEFTEERDFPFRRFPKRYAGKMFRAPAGDLAICYESPSEFRLVIVKDKILLDDGDGQLRALPSGGADARVVSDLLRGDIERLKADWKSELIDDGLRLTPTLEELKQGIKYIDVTVVDARVKSVKVAQRDQTVRLYEFGELSWVTDDEAEQPFRRQ